MAFDGINVSMHELHDVPVSYQGRDTEQRNDYSRDV